MNRVLAYIQRLEFVVKFYGLQSYYNLIWELIYISGLMT